MPAIPSISALALESASEIVPLWTSFRKLIFSYLLYLPLASLLASACGFGSPLHLLWQMNANLASFTIVEIWLAKLHPFLFALQSPCKVPSHLLPLCLCVRTFWCRLVWLTKRWNVFPGKYTSIKPFYWIPVYVSFNFSPFLFLSPTAPCSSSYFLLFPSLH